MNLNSPGWATTIGSGCKGGAVNKPPINTSNTAICRHSNSPQKNRLQRVRASSRLNLWNTSSFLYHHFMSVDFHVGVPLRRGAPGLESSLPNKKRGISERQMAQLNTEPQCMRHSFWQQRECEEQNFKETHCKVPLFVLHGSSTGKASSGCTLSKGQVHHKPLPIKAPSGFPLMGSLASSLHLIKCRAQNKSEFQSAGSLHRERDAGALFDWKVKIFIVFQKWSHLESCWAKGNSESLSWHLR